MGQNSSVISSPLKPSYIFDLLAGRAGDRNFSLLKQKFTVTRPILKLSLSLKIFSYSLGNNTSATGGAKIEITELGADSGSEIEDAEMHRAGQTTKKQKPKKHFIHHNNQVSYKTFGRSIIELLITYFHKKRKRIPNFNESFPNNYNTHCLDLDLNDQNTRRYF